MRMQERIPTEEPIPAHHHDAGSFQQYLDEKYGALPQVAEPDSIDEIYAMVDPAYSDEWDKFQEARYPGTQEVITARRELFSEICEFAKPGSKVAELFESLDPSLANEPDPAHRLSRYSALCEAFFNFRKGPDGRPRERQEIPAILKASREVVGADRWDAIMAAADELGMETNAELADNEAMKSLAILGGTQNAISNRTKYAIEQVEKHDATTESLDFLCSTGEQDFALQEAAKLGVKETDPEKLRKKVYADGAVLHLEPIIIHGRKTPVRVLVAHDIWDPAQEKMVRARTIETTRLLGQASNIKPGDNVKGVSTRFYLPFQEANAREVLTFANGARMGFIGHSAAWAGGTRGANELAQEIKSRVDSEQRLYEKLVATGIAPSINT